MAYTMIAERNNQTVRKQRESALIVLANALTMQSDGWQVVITDDDGGDFEPRAFEASLAERFSWYQVKPEPAVTPWPAEPDDKPLEAEAVVAAELEAENHEAEELESVEADLREIDESDFDAPELAGAELEDAEGENSDLDETMPEEMELAGEPAE